MHRIMACAPKKQMRSTSMRGQTARTKHPTCVCFTIFKIWSAALVCVSDHVARRTVEQLLLVHGAGRWDAVVPGGRAVPDSEEQANVGTGDDGCGRGVIAVWLQCEFCMYVMLLRSSYDTITVLPRCYYRGRPTTPSPRGSGGRGAAPSPRWPRTSRHLRVVRVVGFVRFVQVARVVEGRGSCHAHETSVATSCTQSRGATLLRCHCW